MPPSLSPIHTGHVTPARLAALSRVLSMPLPMLQRLLELSPSLLLPDPADLDAHLSRLALELGLPRRALEAMACHQPSLVVHARRGELRARAEALAGEMRGMLTARQGGGKGDDVSRSEIGCSKSSGSPSSRSSSSKGGGSNGSASNSGAGSSRSSSNGGGDACSSGAVLATERVIRWAACTPSVLVREPQVRPGEGKGGERRRGLSWEGSHMRGVVPL